MNSARLDGLLDLVIKTVAREHGIRKTGGQVRIANGCFRNAGCECRRSDRAVVCRLCSMPLVFSPGARPGMYIDKAMVKLVCSSHIRTDAGQAG
jgi:hypothetical protein